MTYPYTICLPCGNKYGKSPEGHRSTIHEGVCDVCGKSDWVTEPRDFGYPKFPQREGKE